MSKGTWFVLILVVVGVMGGFYYLQHGRQQGPVPVPAAPPPSAAPSVEVPQPPPLEPEIKHPIEQAEGETREPLPPLASSDRTMWDALTGLISQKEADSWIVLEDFVRRVVITVDNLPGEKVTRRMVPLKPIPGRFLTTDEEDNTTLAGENYRRYVPVVRLVESVDAKKLVAVYARFYPLFQQAYKELGYPSGYFNDRLIEAIDDMLQAPQLQGPIKLVRPKLMYQYADPALESLSAGQKMLIRMGPDNEARVKAKLKEIRAQIAGKKSGD